jgi:hypothetical protein
MLQATDPTTGHQQVSGSWPSEALAVPSDVADLCLRLREATFFKAMTAVMHILRRDGLAMYLYPF